MTSIIFKNCKNKNDRDLAEIVTNIVCDERTAIDMYTSLVYSVLYPNDLKNLDRYWEFLDTVITYYETDNMLLINELLHWIHFSFPIARQKAMENVSIIRGIHHNEDTSLTVTFWDYEVMQGDFPEELKNKTEKIFTDISDDLHITYTSTWIYSHISEGMNYTYKENEHPKIDICFPCVQIREKIISIINTEFANMEIEIGRF